VPLGAQSRQARVQITIVLLTLVVSMMSQFYRTSHAVIAPDLVRDLAVAPSVLASMTSAYFLLAALSQLPAGMLFDRYGPRLIVPLLLALAGLGSALFAVSESETGLVVGRALMGVGFGAVMMGCFVLVSRWFPIDRFAMWLGIILGASQLGNLLATTPMAALAVWLGWRGAFWLLAALPLVIAGLFLLLARDAPADHILARADQPRERFGEVLRGVLEILRERRLWPIFALGSVGYACVISILGLWGAPYLADVYGLDAIERGNVMFLMACGLACGQFGLAEIARQTGRLKATIFAGAMVAAACLATLALVPELPGWAMRTVIALLGLSGGFTGLIVLHGRTFYPEHLVSRGMTTTNTFVMAGVSIVQALTGFVMEVMRGSAPVATQEHYAAVFATLAGILVCAGLVYLRAENPPPRRQPAMG